MYMVSLVKLDKHSKNSCENMLIIHYTINL